MTQQILLLYEKGRTVNSTTTSYSYKTNDINNFHLLKSYIYRPPVELRRGSRDIRTVYTRRGSRGFTKSQIYRINAPKNDIKIAASLKPNPASNQ